MRKKSNVKWTDKAHLQTRPVAALFKGFLIALLQPWLTRVGGADYQSFKHYEHTFEAPFERRYFPANKYVEYTFGDAAYTEEKQTKPHPLSQDSIVASTDLQHWGGELMTQVRLLAAPPWRYERTTNIVMWLQLHVKPSIEFLWVFVAVTCVEVNYCNS